MKNKNIFLLTATILASSSFIYSEAFASDPNVIVNLKALKKLGVQPVANNAPSQQPVPEYAPPPVNPYNPPSVSYGAPANPNAPLHTYDSAAEQAANQAYFNNQPKVQVDKSGSSSSWFSDLFSFGSSDEKTTPSQQPEQIATPQMPSYTAPAIPMGEIPRRPAMQPNVMPSYQPYPSAYAAPAPSYQPQPYANVRPVKAKPRQVAASRPARKVAPARRVAKAPAPQREVASAKVDMTPPMVEMKVPVQKTAPTKFAPPKVQTSKLDIPAMPAISSLTPPPAPAASLTSPPVPKMPEIKAPEVKLPEPPKATVPTITLPAANAPKAPEMPALTPPPPPANMIKFPAAAGMAPKAPMMPEAPKLAPSMPQLPAAPKVEIKASEIKAPEIKLPEPPKATIEAPKVPEIKLPATPKAPEMPKINPPLVIVPTEKTPIVIGDKDEKLEQMKKLFQAPAPSNATPAPAPTVSSAPLPSAAITTTPKPPAFTPPALPPLPGTEAAAPANLDKPVPRELPSLNNLFEPKKSAANVPLDNSAPTKDAVVIASAPPVAPAIPAAVSSGSALSVPYTEAEVDIPLAESGKIDGIIQKMNADTSLVVTVVAYASGSAEQSSQAKRTALARSLEIRKYLMERNIGSERIIIHPLGNKATSGVPDRVDFELGSAKKS